MSNVFKLEKPDLSRIDSYRLEKLFSQRLQEVVPYIVKANHPKYLYWSDFKHKPTPEGFKPEELWYLTKRYRFVPLLRMNSPVKEMNGSVFSWLKLPQFDKTLHEVDLNLGGSLSINMLDKQNKVKNEFISRGLMEEAIASAQLEGAHTTRKRAKELLRSGARPRDHAQKMIVNNYRAIQKIEESYKDELLTLELIFELHEILVDQTVKSDEMGRFRRVDEELYVMDGQNVISHILPNIKFVEAEIKRLCNFANDEATGSFIHPVIKAIILHFWIGYLHPFTDGNGRFARALFYWYLLSKGYWAFAYLPISLAIKRSPAQYSDAYIFSEQDDNDLTYFIDFNMRKIEQARADLNKYIDHKAARESKIKKLQRGGLKMNDRQAHLLQYLFEHKDERTTVTMHTNIYNITKKTAVDDLKDLVARGYLERIRSGRHVFYYATEKVKELFKKS